MIDGLIWDFSIDNSSSHWGPSLWDDIYKNKKENLSICLCYTDFFTNYKRKCWYYIITFQKEGLGDKPILNHLTAVENVMGQNEVIVKMNPNSFESEIFFNKIDN